MLTLLPEAEHLLDVVRRTRPGLVRALPAHVSLLYPGPPPREASAVHAHLAGTLPEEVTLAETITGDSGFLGVAVPELEPAAQQMRASFPACLPYAGRYGPAPAAHLTLALGASGTEQEQVRAAVQTELPQQCRLDGPWFVQYTEAGWRPVNAPP